jgi:hypothetical protein
MTKSEYPSLPEQGKNLAKFTFEVVKQALSSNALFVSPEVKQQRLDICKSCEYYDASQVRCKHCGCFLDHKANFALDSCPIDKWSVSDSDWLNGEFDKVVDKVQNPQKESDTPQFPRNPEIGQVYGWKDRRWQWNGSLWDFIPE